MELSKTAISLRFRMNFLENAKGGFRIRRFEAVIKVDSLTRRLLEFYGTVIAFNNCGTRHFSRKCA